MPGRPIIAAGLVPSFHGGGVRPVTVPPVPAPESAPRLFRDRVAETGHDRGSGVPAPERTVSNWKLGDMGILREVA